MKAIVNLTLMFFIIVCASAFAGEPYYFKKCNHAPDGTSVPFWSFTNLFRKECAPDTLYSWQNKNDKYLQNFSESPLSKDRYIYAWRTPMGTFGYGKTQIRMKLKENVTFKLIDQNKRDCRKFDTSEKQITVYVAVLKDHHGSEYLICDKNVLASWSKNTEGAKIEAQKEIQYIDKLGTKNRQKYDVYVGSNFWKKKAVVAEKWLVLHSLQPYFPPVLDSDTDWTAGSFLDRLDSLGVKKEADDGVIFYNDGYTDGHFDTIVKTPFKLNQAEVEQMDI